MELCALLTSRSRSPSAHASGDRRWIPPPPSPRLGHSARPISKPTSRPHCDSTKVPVALAAGQAAEQTIFGQLCLPPDSDRQQVPTVHLAVHGATYSHLYWGWPYRPETHSYAGHLLAAGYAVFVFDRIGTGQSSHPPGAAVTIEVNAFVVHQLVRALRSGAIGETAFQRVVLVGHGVGIDCGPGRGEHLPRCGRRGAERHQPLLTERCIIAPVARSGQSGSPVRRAESRR